MELKIMDKDRMKKRYIMGLMLILSVTYIFWIFPKDMYTYGDSYKDKLIRFHVLANSDSPQDQDLKLKVRDRVIELMNPKFDQSESLNATRTIIKENLVDIEETAERVLREYGSDYTVKVSLEDVLFPTKNYGNITLPAGKYEALRIIIGKGEGSNWWCVLFPPLCFIDSDKALADESTKQELMDVLTEEEYNMINTAKSKDEIPIKLKFKVVEIIEYAKDNFQRVVGMK